LDGLQPPGVAGNHSGDQRAQSERDSLNLSRPASKKATETPGLVDAARYHFYAGLGQFSVSLVGVLSIVANQALDRFFHKDFCELAALGLAHAEAWLYSWDEFWS
jgi:hypothetical protein